MTVLCRNLPVLMVFCIFMFVHGKKDKQIHILGLFGMQGAWPSGHACLPSTLMALEDVNNREDILSDYELVLHWNDTQCDGGVATDVMYHQLYRPPTKIMILGPGSSIATEPTAKASHLWNMLQLSYAASSPALSDKKAYPRFLRVMTPDNLMNPAKVALMQGYEWNRVATIHETYPLFSKVTDDLVVRLADHNMTLITSEIFTDDPTLQVQNLKKHDARIIIIGCYEENGARIMCEAYKLGLYGSKYAWLFPGWYSLQWWTKYPDVGCTPDQLAIAIDGYIAFAFAMLNPNDDIGVAGITSREFKTEFDSLLTDHTLVGIPEAPLAYDAVWAVALTLNKTQEDFAKMGYMLEEFTYESDELANILLENMWNLNFMGVKGPVYFDENGDSPSPVNIYQMQDGTLNEVGIFFPTEGFIRWYSDIEWKGGSPPKDSTTYVLEQSLVSSEVYLAVCAFATLGVFIAILLLAFNIHFREQRLIKMSSPVMNNIILVGCVVSYVTVYLQELSDSSVQLLCQMRTLTVMVGFSLAVGALFAKTWRVYVIFTNTTKRVTLKDSQLILMVLVLVSVDVLVFGIREALDPLAVVKEIAVTEEYEDGDLVVEKEVLTCTSDYSVYFKAVIYTYKGLLLVFGAFLAWQTRKVTIPALNDSQYIGMCIYNVSVLSILGVILAFALENQVQLQYVLTSGFLIFGTTIVQLIIFIPKVLKFKDIQNQIGDANEAAETSTQFGAKPAGGGTMTTTVSADDQPPSARLQQELDDVTAENNALREELVKTKEQLQKANAEVAELRKQVV